MAKTTTDQVKLGKATRGIVSANPTTGKDAGSTLSNPLASYFNKNLAQLRNNGKTLEAIRTLARVHGDVSAAVAALVRLANTELSMRVYDADHQLSGEGSDLLRSIIARFNNTYDYTEGFDDRMPFESIKETLLRSIPLTGACAMELVLDKQGMPYRMQPANIETIKFKVGSSKITGGKKVFPYQTTQDGEVDLNIPTFFYASLDQDLSTAYSNSPLEPALNTSFYHAETVDDIRRVVKRSGHSRLVVKLMTQKLVDSAPLSIKADPDKLAAWVEESRKSVADEIEKLSPEAALVLFDTMEADYLNSEIGASADYRPLMELIDAILATALKTPAAVVGKRTSSGSQNTSSTESLLFIKTASGIQPPVAAVLSRALTLAIRLFGFEGYVKCTFKAIDLRPEVELNAFHTMRQTMILEQLSYGFLTDDEAAEELGTGPRAPGAPPLSGTMFLSKQQQTAPSPNGDPARQALTPTTPKSGGGKDNKPR